VLQSITAELAINRDNSMVTEKLFLNELFKDYLENGQPSRTLKKKKLLDLVKIAHEAEESWKYLKEKISMIGKSIVRGERIGSDAQSDVFLCYLTNFLGFNKSEKPYAVKRIQKRGIEQEKRIRREISLLWGLSYHFPRHFINFIGWKDDSDFVFIVTELATCDLASLILQPEKYKKKLTDQAKSHILLEICKGISFLHYLRLAHRDLKPQNVLIVDEHVKLCDLETVKTAQTYQFSANVLSLNWAAPEQKQEGFQPTSKLVKVDIWTFGLLIFFVFMKKLPCAFGINGFEAPIVNWMKAEINDLQVSNFWQALIFRCLKEIPDDRPDINIIRHDIEKHLNAISLDVKL